MFHTFKSLGSDSERQSGPIEGRDFYINKGDVTVKSDLSQGLTTALGMAVEDQVYLNQVNLECCEQLNIQGEDVDAKSDDTIDPDEELPPIKPLPPLSRGTSLSSLTNDLSYSRAVPNTGNFLLTRMIQMSPATSLLDENSSSFDERYTYHHPPLIADANAISDAETGWASVVASTRTPTTETNKVDINMNPGQTSREIGSVGYLNNLTRGPDLDGKTTVSLSGKTSWSSKCSVGFIAYLHDRYARTSRRNQVFVWLFFVTLILLLVISCVIGVVGASGRKSGQSIDTAPHQLAQPTSTSNVNLENGNISEAPSNEAILFEELAVRNSTTTTIPTTSADTILQDQYRDHEGIFNNDGQPSDQSSSPTTTESFPPSRQTQNPTPMPSTRPTLAPVINTPAPTRRPRKRQSLKPNIPPSVRTLRPSRKPTNAAAPDSKPDNPEPATPRPPPSNPKPKPDSSKPSLSSIESSSPSHHPFSESPVSSTPLDDVSASPTVNPSGATLPTSQPASDAPISIASISTAPISTAPVTAFPVSLAPSRNPTQEPSVGDTPQQTECLDRKFSFDKENNACANRDVDGEFDSLSSCCKVHFGSYESCNFIDVCGIYTHAPIYIVPSPSPVTDRTDSFPSSASVTDEPTPEPIENEEADTQSPQN